MAQQRTLMAFLGLLAGTSLYAIYRIAAEGLVSGHLALPGFVLAAVFSLTLLILVGAIDLPRAVLRAGVLGIVVAVLAGTAALRFDQAEALAGSPLAVLSILILTFLPQPFLLAAESYSWRDYPSLFVAAWSIVMRLTVGAVFLACLWAVVYLGHVLLSRVGIDLLGQLVLLPLVPWAISGAALGLAMAMAEERSDIVSADLVLRLMRILVPVVLAVLVVFLVAIAAGGTWPLLSGFSLGAILLILAGLAISLVNAAVGQTDFDAAHNRLLVLATQALAALLWMPALLAAWSVWQRVLAHGWTPDRLLAATAAALGMGYGALFLLAVLRGAGWMERVRQSSIWMALALMLTSALWLSPLLDPEKISANSQVARYRAGQTPADALDLAALGRWGRSGQAAIETLRGLAPGDPALARALAETAGPVPVDAAELARLRTDLSHELAVRPATETAFRDRALSLATGPDLQAWKAACASALPLGETGCLLIVGDFLPARPGPEGLLILAGADGYDSYIGLRPEAETLERLSVESDSGALPELGQGAALIAALLAATPAFRPVGRNELVLPPGGALALRP